MAERRPVTILCISSESKGHAFLVAAKEAGARVILLTEEKHANAPWPRASIDERYLMPDLSQREDVIRAVSYLARSHVIDAVVPLDDYEVGTAAALREHLRLPGMGESQARFFRDKLAMRRAAVEAGLRCPAFSGIFNYDELSDFMERVAPPWVLKPRFEAGAVGIRIIDDEAALWHALDELGDLQSFYLLEEFVSGDVYHVDSIWWDRRIQMLTASRYGQPPLQVSHKGGVFTTRLLPPDGREATQLREQTRQLLAHLRLGAGVAHTEFIRAEDSGAFYFLETAARVGGAHIAELVYFATGRNLWEEWARIVVAQARGEDYLVETPRDRFAGLLICLAQQEHPDLSPYSEPEVVWRLERPYHAGLIVAAPDAARVDELIEQYGERFVHDFLTSGPQQQIKRTQT